ncbi:glycosyltransferase family 4 protein [Aerosakkonemataceae cyanobacterium BLCC-F154]|uniref:Glycosyltransferase family 4 protein n=1 Tax=Floridaenema fluviatile BLCC-F154 TaxID=3153640 RepID=A0ABV4Y5M4_9CYAN
MFSPIKKHIALISVHGDPAIEIGKEEAGGQNVYVRQVGKALAQKGWLVDMFTRKANSQQATIVQHSPNCRTIRLTAGPEEFVPRDDIFAYLPEFVNKFLQFQQDNQINYSLVHTNYWLSAWVGMQLKKTLDVKQVHTYHSLGAVKYKSVTTIPMIATTRLGTEKAVLESADRIVATSPQEREHMRSLVSQKGEIDIIPCGTDISHFGSISREAAREKLGIDRETQIILYVGRFDKRKGIETLVRAVGQSETRKNNQLKLIIGGGFRPGHSDGKEHDRIAKIVNELGLNDITIFPGRLSREALPIYYTAADLTVVPSHYEPFGLVTIEAMACGTPVIGSDVGGLQFTIKPEVTGLLCPPKDSAAFAVAIDRILSQPKWRNELGINARKRVQEMFSWDGVASQLSNLYLDLIKQPVAKELSTVSA